MVRKFFLQWHLSEACNLKCLHCYQENHTPVQLKYDDLIKILNQYRELLDKLKTTGHINLTGGEPLCSPYFFKILDEFKKDSNKYSFSILTNGTLMTEEYAKRIKSYNPEYVQVSLEGGKRMNDYIRGKGVYKKVAQAIKTLKKHDIYVSLSFTATKLNYKELIYNQKLNHIQEVVEESQQTTQSVLSYGLRINNPNSNDFYKLSVYNALLGGTPSSKLFQNFREKESLAYTVRSRYYRFKDIIIIYAGIQKENYEKAKLVLENEINKIKDGEISDEEFEASKKSIISDLKEWNDSKIALSKMFISNLFSLKNDSLTLEQMVDKFEKVTKQDIIDIASKITIEKIYFLGGENNA